MTDIKDLIAKIKTDEFFRPLTREDGYIQPRFYKKDLDALIALVQRLEQAEAVIERAQEFFCEVEYHAETHNLREGDNCECDMCSIFKAMDKAREYLNEEK